MKDPAFLFYPGDYLRDTQNLSEKAQVAYDRIMCEHMRKICKHMNKIVVSKKQVDFFIKRLTDEQKEELMFVLTKINGNYQIEWVAESIAKRKNYSESRRKNREGEPKKDMLTYDSHMENENESESENIIIEEKKELVFYEFEELKSELLNSHVWKEELCSLYNINYDRIDDLIKTFLSEQKTDDNLIRSLGEIKRHFRHTIKKQQTNGKYLTKAELRERALNSVAENLDG